MGPTKEMLISVGAYDFSKVALLDLNESKMHWKLICDHLPFENHTGGKPHRTLQFDEIIIALDCIGGDIWCMDVKQPKESKWHKSECKLPIENCYGCEIWKFEDAEDRLHLIHLRASHQLYGPVNEHFHAPIKQIISKKLRAERKKKYMPLVLGYLREQETALIDRHIPFALKCLICKYFVFY